MMMCTLVNSSFIVVLLHMLHSHAFSAQRHIVTLLSAVFHYNLSWV